MIRRNKWSETTRIAGFLVSHFRRLRKIKKYRRKKHVKGIKQNKRI